MNGRPSRQRGASLIEVLLAGALMVIVLGAVLGSAEMFGTRARANSELTADQQAARVVLDQVTRELRSAGARQEGAALLRAGPADLVFLSDRIAGSGGAWRAVRYCWDGARLHRQQSGGVTLPAAACPAAGWGSGQVLLSEVTAAPFSVGAGTAPVVHTRLLVGRAPALESAVAVRNLRLAADSVTCTPTGGGAALLALDLGVGPALALPLHFADLIGLKALLFGGAPPPAGWGCP